MTKTIRDILDTDNLNIRGTVLFAGHANRFDAHNFILFFEFPGRKFLFQNYETQF